MRSRLLLVLVMLLPAACSSSSGSLPAASTQVPPPAFLLFRDDPRTGEFYDWNGHLIGRFQGSMFASASTDARYYVSIGDQIVLSKRDGTLVGKRPNLAGSWFPWAKDGDILCGATWSGQTASVFLLDAAGGIRFVKPAISGSVQSCSLASRRAVLLYGPETAFAIVSLDDGRLELNVPLRWQSGGYVFSPDDMWLAEPAILSDGVTQGTAVFSLTDGRLVTEWAGLRPVDFTPDSRYLLLNDEKQNLIRMIDWRTGAQAWIGTGYPAGLIQSDPATDKVLLYVRPGGPSDQTLTMLIVSASGVAVPFTRAAA